MRNLSKETLHNNIIETFRHQRRGTQTIIEPKFSSTSSKRCKQCVAQHSEKKKASKRRKRSALRSSFKSTFQRIFSSKQGAELSAGAFPASFGLLRCNPSSMNFEIRTNFSTLARLIDRRISNRTEHRQPDDD